MAKKQVAPKLQFRIMLNKQLWVVYLYTKANFAKFSPGNEGLTRYDHKKNKYFDIHFAGPRVSKDTISHELLHAYMSYRDYSKLTPAKLEEAVCELIGKKHKTLYMLTEKIHARLTEGVKNGNKKEVPCTCSYTEGGEKARACARHKKQGN